MERPTEQNLRGALASYRQAIACDAGFVQAHCALGMVYVMLATYEFVELLPEAEQAARTALSIDPHLPDAWAVLGAASSIRRDWLQAEQHLATAAAAELTYYVIAVRAMYVHWAVGHLRLAREDDPRATDLAPIVPQNLIRHGMLNRMAGPDEQALRDAELAASLGFPDHAGPIPMIRSHHARRMGRYAEAAQHMARCFPPKLSHPALAG